MVTDKEILDIIKKQGLSMNHIHLIYMTNGDYNQYLTKMYEKVDVFRYEVSFRIDDYNKLNEWIQSWY